MSETPPPAELPASVLEFFAAVRQPGRPRVLPEVATEGERHDALVSLAGTLRVRGLGYGAILAALRGYNTEQTASPKPDEELEAIARWAEALPLPDSSRSTGAESAESAERGGIPRIPRLPRTETRWAPPLLEDAAMHGPAGRWALSMHPYSEACAAGVLVAELVSFGSAAGRAAYMQVGATRHHPNENELVVGPTATARKGEALRLGIRPVGLADKDWEKRVARGFGSGEAIVWEVRDAQYRLDEEGNHVPVDEGVEDKRLLIYEDELAHPLAVAAREGSTLSSVMRSGWDGTRLENRTKGRRLVGTDAHVSVLAAITPEELRRRVPETEIANGFLNRFLLVAVARDHMLPQPPPIPGGLEVPYVEHLSQALEFARSGAAGPMRRSPEAGERWAYAYVEELSVERHGLVGAACSRAEAHALRLSMLYALLDRSATIELAHVEAALALWRYCEASALLVFGDRLGDPDADRIVEALRAAGPEGLTRDEVRDVFSRHRTSTEVDLALSTLEAAGRITVEREETGGRPATRIRLVEQ